MDFKKDIEWQTEHANQFYEHGFKWVEGKLSHCAGWNHISHLPEENKVCLFVEIYKGRILETFVGSMDTVRAFRKYQLENDYTHWMELPGINTALQPLQTC